LATSFVLFGVARASRDCRNAYLDLRARNLSKRAFL
jgi:hypothetical protein